MGLLTPITSAISASLARAQKSAPAKLLRMRTAPFFSSDKRNDPRVVFAISERFEQEQALCVRFMTVGLNLPILHNHGEYSTLMAMPTGGAPALAVNGVVLRMSNHQAYNALKEIENRWDHPASGLERYASDLPDALTQLKVTAHFSEHAGKLDQNDGSGDIVMPHNNAYFSGRHWASAPSLGVVRPA